MAKQTINLGTMADNRSGDPLRTAFTKINENFDELYAADGNPTTPSFISSGDTAPGSAVVANTDSVDVNFAMIGTKFKFKDNGDLQLNGGGLVDQDGNSLLNQGIGSGGNLTVATFNGDWHPTTNPQVYNVADYGAPNVFVMSQNGASADLLVNLPANPEAGKQFMIKFTGRGNTDYKMIVQVAGGGMIDNQSGASYNIEKDNGFLNVVWDAGWNTYWVIGKDLI